MSDKSCIIHAPESLFVAIRQDYVGICKARGMRHPHCAAALLNMFERWHNVKLAEFDQELAKHQAAKANKQHYKVSVNMWIFMSNPAMREEMQGLFGETVIRHSVQDLEQAKFIKSRHNPKDVRDRTLQYLFFPMRVQNALYKWASSTDAPSRISTASKRYKYGVQSVKKRGAVRKSTGTLPQSHSQTPSQKPSQNDDESSLRKDSSPQNGDVPAEKVFDVLSKMMFPDEPALTKADQALVGIATAWLEGRKPTARQAKRNLEQLTPASNIPELKKFFSWYRVNPDTKNADFPVDVIKLQRHYQNFRKIYPPEVTAEGTHQYYTPTADELAHMEAVKAAALERMNNGRLTA